MHRRRSSAWLSASLLIVGAVLGTACADDKSAGGAAREQDDGTIEITYQGATESLAILPVLRAFQAGYFEDEGLAIEQLPINTNSAQVAAAVANGQADIAQTGATGTIAAAAAGQDVKAFATLTGSPTIVLSLNNETVERLAGEGVTPDSDPEDRLRALQGLTLAVAPAGSSTDILFRRALTDVGLDPDADITMQPIADIQALVATAREGRVDGYIFSPPPGVIGVSEGWAQQWLNLGTDLPAYENMPFVDLVASSSTISENAEGIRRFLQAIDKANQDLVDDPDTVRTEIKAEYFADLDQDVYDTAFDVVLPIFAKGLVSDEEGFAILLDIVNSTSDEPAELAFDDVYDVSIAEEVEGA